MNVKSTVLNLAASALSKRLYKEEAYAIRHQERVFQKIIRQASNTAFGKEYRFSKIKHFGDFVKRVPIQDYEMLKPYIERIKQGERDVLWKGMPKYFAKTSGTTSGTKYIPITRQSIKNHINSARNALFSYVGSNRKTKIFDGQMLFLSGSPELEWENRIGIGRLSGIVNHEVPRWFTKNKLPSAEINMLQPWEYKIEKIVEDLLPRRLSVISGIPPWVQMFCEKVIEASGKNTVADVFPHLELYIHGGVNYKPYYQKIKSLIGKDIALVETYPASEGFIAYQPDYREDGMRLVTNSGIFFEFVEKSQIYQENPERIWLGDVEANKDYTVILSSNAGLWAYLIGDVVQFQSVNPFRLKVTGRVNQYISAFGEHVLASEVDYAMNAAQLAHQFRLVEFHVAPQVNPTDNSKAYHEWFIEFEKEPDNLQAIADTIHNSLASKNGYYADLIKGHMLDCVKIRSMPKGSFLRIARETGQIGEQFKVQRLSNDRELAERLKQELPEYK